MKPTIFSLIVVALLSGCPDVAPPTGTVVICDPSGGPATCTPQWLAAQVERWARTAAEGSRFVVVTPGGSFSQTVVGPDLRLHLPARRHERLARNEALQAMLRELAAIGPGEAVPAERNRSDLLSALSVASRLGREMRSARIMPTALRVASDGRMISGPHNFEEEVPFAEDFLTYVENSGISLSLSSFVTAEWCGLHIGPNPSGGPWTAQDAARLETLLVELMEQSGGPSLALTMACRLEEP